MKKIIIVIILLIIIIAGYFLILNKKASDIKISSDSGLEDMNLDTFNIGTELSSDFFPEI
ncbi:MAG: hypothetical protein V1686_02725 [Patescibacteria group bacterium]